VASNNWNTSDLIDTRDFFNRMVDQKQYLSLSELDIPWDHHYAVSNGATLALMHFKGITHGDFHADNLFYTPITGYGGVCDPETIKKTDLDIEPMYRDLIPAFITLTPDYFKALLVGYFKSAVVLLDNKKAGFSKKLLEVVTPNSHLLIHDDPNKQWYIDYIQRLHIAAASDKIVIKAVEKPQTYLRFIEKILFRTLKAAGLQTEKEGYTAFDILELQEYFYVAGLILKDIQANDLVKMLNEVCVDAAIELVDITRNFLGDDNAKFWNECLIVLDTISNLLDKRSQGEGPAFLKASIDIAQLSLELLKKLSDTTDDIKQIEIIELSLKRRHNRFNWMTTPSGGAWLGIPYNLPEIRLDEPASKLADELGKYTESVENWQYIPHLVLPAFGYYNLLVKTQCAILARSVHLLKQKRTRNILWTSGYRAMAYARRNLFILCRYLLEQQLTWTDERIACQYYLDALETSRVTLVTYWTCVSDYYGEHIKTHLQEFTSEYEKFVPEIQSILQQEAKMKNINFEHNKSEFKALITSFKKTVIRTDCFPL
jgi:hypothetical protein